MSTIVGIDIGSNTQVVSKIIPTEPSEDEIVMVQTNYNRGAEFSYDVSHKADSLGICDFALPISNDSYTCSTPFTVEYLKDNLSIDSEKPFCGVTIVKKEGNVYFNFKTRDYEKEVSVPSLMGLIFLYEYQCILNVALSFDNLLYNMSFESMQTPLKALKPIYAIPSNYDSSDVSRLKTIMKAYNLPEASFVHRSIAAAIGSCYSMWKDAYAKDKTVTRQYTIIDVGYTSTSLYLIGVSHNHMKVKCHLHSTVACGRLLEEALGECIRRNASQKKLFKNESACICAERLAKEHLAEFYDSKKETIKISNASLFVLDGKKVNYEEKISRKDFIKECKKLKVVEAFTDLVDSFTKVLKGYDVTVDKLIPVGPYIEMDEFKTCVTKAIGSFSQDKRLISSLNKPEMVSAGATHLLSLILSKKASIDPAFVNIVFWPTAEVAELNTECWNIPGTLKIKHTNGGMNNQASDLPEEVTTALTTDITAFSSWLLGQQAIWAKTQAYRNQCLEEYSRIYEDWRTVSTALERRDSAQAEASAPPAGDGVKEEPVTKPKSDERREMEVIEGDLEEIKNDIDGLFLAKDDNNVNVVLNRLTECANRIRTMGSICGVSLQERTPAATEPKEQPKQKSGGCCKGKGDVVTAGSV